jgi:DNA repair photolyase
LKRHKPPGRAAGFNPANRYHTVHTEPDRDIQTTEISARTTIEIDHARQAITYNNSPDIRFDRSINPYRGCEHGCIYCYARPTHAWLDLSPGLDFEQRLFRRPELPELLRRELAQANYQPAPIAVGSITDAYQPIDRHYRITREVLQVLAESRHPALLITKSSLIERDLDLLADMAAQQLVEVAISLTTLDPLLARRMEPRASTPRRRLETIAALAAAGVPVRVLLTPLVPVLTEPEIERLLEAAAAHGAVCASYVLLRLPAAVSPLFRDWLQRHYPDSASHVMAHQQAMRAGSDNDSEFHRRMRGHGVYADIILQRFELARRRQGLQQETALRCDLFQPPSPHRGQLPLF